MVMFDRNVVMECIVMDMCEGLVGWWCGLLVVLLFVGLVVVVLVVYMDFGNFVMNIWVGV